MSPGQLEWLVWVVPLAALLSLGAAAWGWQRRERDWSRLDALEREQPLSRLLVQVLVCWVFAVVPFAWLLTNLLMSWPAGVGLVLALSAGVAMFGVLTAAGAMVFGVVLGRARLQPSPH